MKNFPFFVLLFLGVTLISCKGKKMATDYDEMAKELCDCMNPLVEMNEEIQALTQAGDTEAVGAMFAELEGKFAEGEKCATGLQGKYGDMDTPEEEAKAKAAIRKACPKVADMMNQSEKLE